MKALKNTKARETVLFLTSFFVISFLIFNITSGGDTPYNYFTRLADAFIHGRLYLTNQPPWLSELVPMAPDKFYVVQPPMGALLAIPFVAIFGINFPQQIIAHLIGAGISVVCMLLAKEIVKTRASMIWAGILGSVGTIMWYEASTGSVWYLGQIIACFFLLLAILESNTKKRALLVGFFISCAYLSRIHTILSAPFFLYMLYPNFSLKEIKIFLKEKNLNYLKPFFYFCLGALPLFIFNALYNFARWGVIFDKGYFLIPGIYDEPWFSKGMLNVSYIPDHLSLLFLKLPKKIDRYPYLVPSWYGLAIWLTTPALFVSLKAKIKDFKVVLAWVSSFLIFLVVALRGGTGWTQFGYRYAVDFYPFLIFLTLLGIQKTGLKKYHWVLLLIGVLVNLWGVLWINKFGWVEF